MKSKGSEMFASAVQSIHAIDDALAIELKSLTRILIDSEEGLSDASQNIGNAEIAALFRSIAGERNALAIELQDLIRDQGDEAPVSGPLRVRCTVLGLIFEIQLGDKTLFRSCSKSSVVRITYDASTKSR